MLLNFSKIFLYAARPDDRPRYGVYVSWINIKYIWIYLGLIKKYVFLMCINREWMKMCDVAKESIQLERQIWINCISFWRAKNAAAFRDAIYICIYKKSGKNGVQVLAEWNNRGHLLKRSIMFEYVHNTRRQHHGEKSRKVEIQRYTRGIQAAPLKAITRVIPVYRFAIARYLKLFKIVACGWTHDV